MESGKAVEFFLAHKVPIRPMSGDGDIGGGSIDHMVSIGINSVIGTLEQIACHLESGGQLETDLAGGCDDCLLLLLSKKEERN